MTEDVARVCSVCSEKKKFQHQFSDAVAFIDHLRTFHCTKEGGSYVCRYGPYGICRTLPLEGVSSCDYEEHIMKDHAMGTASLSKRPSQASTSFARDADARPPLVVTENASNVWTIHCSTQNLPAVLNDPRKTRRENAAFFTRYWGDSFVERTEVPHSALIPRITEADFAKYLKRHKKRLLIHRADELSLNLRNKSLPDDSESAIKHSAKPDLSEVPKVFLNPKFHLGNEEFFHAVFYSSNFELPPRGADSKLGSSGGRFGGSPARSLPSPILASIDSIDVASTFNETNDAAGESGGAAAARLDARKTRLLQEKLSHFLDLVEEQIASHVVDQSPAFFNAMTNHDQLQVYLGQTKESVQVLRERLKSLDDILVGKSLNLLKLQRERRIKELVAEKLNFMAMVKETQQNIHLCLGGGDYLGALDIIAATQEVLKSQLCGIVAFRYLGVQLTEIQKAISKMLQEDFVKYIRGELSKPMFDAEQITLEEHNLAMLVGALLRLRDFRVVGVIQREIQNSLKSLVRQVVQDGIADADLAVTNDTSIRLLADQMRKLNFEQWLKLLQSVFSQTLLFAQKTKMIQSVLLELIDTNGQDDFVADDANVGGSSGVVSPSEEREADQSVTADLSALDVETNADESLSSKRISLRDSVSLLAQETIALVHERCARVIASKAKDGFVERLTSDQFVLLHRAVATFSKDCENLVGRKVPIIDQFFQSHATRFAARFHEEKKQKLANILDNECWKPKNFPCRYQAMVDHISKTGSMRAPAKLDGEDKENQVLLVNGEKYLLIGTATVFLGIIIDYCQCVEDIPLLTTELFPRLEELLRIFNSRVCQLVLGAGATQLVGLKRISVKVLALASRAVQLISLYIPLVQKHFQRFLPEKHSNMLKHFGTVLEDYKHHVAEIYAKLISIMDTSFSNCFSQWKLRPPSPSPEFAGLVKNIRLFYEAVVDVLPSADVQKIFAKIHETFKERLRCELKARNISQVDNNAYRYVCTEFSFYMESIRQLPCCATYNESLSEVLLERS